jgi:hypothetical protein
VNKKKGRTGKRGRPPTFDETAEEELVNDVKKRRKERDTVFGFELMVMIRRKKQKNAEENPILPQLPQLYVNPQR